MTDESDLVVHKATIERVADWIALRQLLWPHARLDHHENEVKELLEAPDRAAGYLASTGKVVVGLAEAALRFDYVNGCASSPVLFLEGIYVRPDWRRLGIARELCRAIEAWGSSHNCLEFASDTSLSNPEAQLLHRALGFAETERVVFYRKLIPLP